MKSIISLGSDARGQRSFVPMDFPSMFLNFSFSERLSFNSIFLAPHTSNVIGNRNEVVFAIPDFNSGNLLHAPSEATHFKVINLITTLSVYTFNTSRNLGRINSWHAHVPEEKRLFIICF
jgi:hypothetical protein